MKIKFSIFKKIYISCLNFFSKYRILMFVLLILFALAYLGAVFYFYVWRDYKVDVVAVKTTVNMTLYQKVMENFNQREVNYKDEENKTYSDPFK